ncbi:UDP-2,4-diacetamido-2,4,6-trideoxy-beta-L-altropyranose hydrolase [Acinetobacter johnsonii]|uniref:UDP-2,4-diacetamido-2,4, 6-trideoxy-beta-L-altropyranose hydrolase n=1 Tax=Acinetobacter johnsonii TaxID=40214 RepID=UPI0022E561E8|nr:UDP-2,4-diacetamido-2,4,6-trideoxy-beta-L-altropyranose hydrolase [Acinetobacter johnsonii]
MVIQSNTAMKVVFRVDASIQMGTGHVMRCLTLADALKNQGAECYFICREHSGNLIGLITQRGYHVDALPYMDLSQEDKLQNHNVDLAHASWLGTTQKEDSSSCIPIVEALKPDWLVVDHYALDIRWEQVLRPYCKQVMVIDDLADREHNCDLLLDQTFGRDLKDYIARVPVSCEILCGAEYALLRPEFSQWREYSLERRENSQLKHLLINLGGVDKDNLTTQILIALKQCSLPSELKITVVMGGTAPWIKEVCQQAKDMPWITDVMVGVNNVAELMANSDLAIGAAGSTSWERCCLGLPCIVICLAENQKKVINILAEYGAAISCSLEDSINGKALDSKLTFAARNLPKLIQNSISVVDGLGCNKVVNKIKAAL